MLDLLNDARSAYRSGNYGRALAAAGDVLAGLETSAEAINQNSCLIGIDAATLRGLALLGSGRVDEGRIELEMLHLRRFPDHPEPSTVLAEMEDPEARNLLAFGQIALVELAANALDPPQRVEMLLQSLWPTAQAARLPLILQFWRFQSARCLRLLGQSHRAVEEWLLVGRDTAELLRDPNQTRAGYPPTRSFCEAALTLEAMRGREYELRTVTSELLFRYVPDEWDKAVLQGIRVRQGELRVPRPPAADAGWDDELRRCRVDAWYCGLDNPSPDDSECFLATLKTASLAAQLVYPGRYLRLARTRGVSACPRVSAWVDRLLSSLPDELCADFGVPNNVHEFCDAADITRCLAI